MCEITFIILTLPSRFQTVVSYVNDPDIQTTLKNDHRSFNQGFNGIRTRDLRDTAAMFILHFYLQPQFIYELFHIIFTSFHSSREDMNSIN